MYDKGGKAERVGNCNTQSIFLNSVEESEIIKIVKNWKNKKSTGFDNIDMTIVKHVISHIVIEATQLYM